MKIIEKLFDWLKALHASRNKSVNESKVESYLPPVKFEHITRIARPPKNDDVLENTFYLVTTETGNKWALFRCPCGCNYVVTLSLQPIHNPHWKLSYEINERPTLYPSVWQDEVCFSHFWLKDGRIHWCPDTGTSPEFMDIT